jgi:nucleoside-diphosphate-sugar epimerase
MLRPAGAAALSLELARSARGGDAVTAGEALRGRRVLVVGASGFLGGRLAERLVVEHGAQVRVLIRRVASATRLARLPVEIVPGDVLDPESVSRAAEGCTVLFNCAKGTGGDSARRRATDVDGVRHLIDASGAGTRLVQVSSLAVYDLPVDGDVTERTPDAAPGDAYADAKLAGERLALELGGARGIPVTVVQPTVVYGPFATVHGSDILDELRSGRMILVNGGQGICNAVYVDDAVTALLLAATSPRAPGERFLISGAQHPTWADFFGGFARMLGAEDRLVPMSASEAHARWAASRRRPWLASEALTLLRRDRSVRKRLLATREGLWLRSLAERLAPGRVRAAERWAEPAARVDAAAAEPPLGPMRPWLVDYLAKRARVRIDKARELLGYRPEFSLGAGLALTESWARWAGLAGEPTRPG